jgi:methylmalonyl-CoA mutase
MRLRFVTAASLFDGHDVSINIMRRLLQSKGAEVIHLGHNRSAHEVVTAAIQEDAHAVALSSYQGGHNEYFAYVRQLLDEAGASNVRIFGGGGGVITPSEIKALQAKGITRIYSPEDGMKLGLPGIIDDMIARANHETVSDIKWTELAKKKTFSHRDLGKIVTTIEETGESPVSLGINKAPVLGVTGTGGAGKSSLIDELLLRMYRHYPEKRVALISIDPTRKKTQGALLGDRIRLGSASFENFFIRSLATRDSNTELSPQIQAVVAFLRSQAFDLVIVETSGIGQAADEITKVADKCLYVMTPEYGAASQLEKIEMLDSADFIALNKFEKPRSEDALRDIRRQYRRNKTLFAGHPGSPSDDELPIYGTMASKFNDTGVSALFGDIARSLGFDAKPVSELSTQKIPKIKGTIIPPERALYLREIAQACRDYNRHVETTAEELLDYESLVRVNELLPNQKELGEKLKEKKAQIGEVVFGELEEYKKIVEQYRSGTYTYHVRDRALSTPTKYTSLSGLEISKVAAPKLLSLADTYRFVKKENLPGFFPFVAGIFPFRRSDEDPKRMFAGEGGPTRTNKRFHFLSKDDPAKRLSTAFDSVTLYGEDPHERPDIFGKIGEAGVSIATLDDMQELYKGFDLTGANTSVSMTINGPAPIILALFMNTAIKQKLSGDDFWDEKKRIEIMRSVRGTVQADILKEDQAQNTCIFSLEFALKMMGDMQEYFCKHAIKNYYSVSISGYHIAEAGANPITQTAFTLSNGFTYVEYYLGRGMKIDDFSGNLSYFFSNGLDPEYTVIGRVARKIWAVALRDRYGASEKSQKFKYHIQTSGRSLHAQEMSFNDIRTTLQAFLALSDNCNSLHTNAYDEAITTPPEESVRRAMAIQMVINKEFGLNRTDNPLQGAYIVQELADLVEEAVLTEFENISDKGGVLGAMESMYQRSKIQEESLYYETLKDNGQLPIIGVNTFISPHIDEQMAQEIELSRCSDEEKTDQITRLRNFQKRDEKKKREALERLKACALANGNIFEELLYSVNYCSLGEITNLLYDVGGRYRRNM